MEQGRRTNDHFHLFSVSEIQLVHVFLFSECRTSVLKELCGHDVRAKFISNAPCGYLKYKLPPAEQEKDGAVGAKVMQC